MTSGNRSHDSPNSIFCGAKSLCPTENRSWLVILIASPAELHVGRAAEGKPDERTAVCDYGTARGRCVRGGVPGRDRQDEEREKHGREPRGAGTGFGESGTEGRRCVFGTHPRRRIHRHRAARLHADEGRVVGATQVGRPEVRVLRAGRGADSGLRRCRRANGPGERETEVPGRGPAGRTPNDRGIREAARAMAARRPSAEPHRATPFSCSLISAKENAPRSWSALLPQAITIEMIVWGRVWPGP